MPDFKPVITRDFADVWSRASRYVFEHMDDPDIATTFRDARANLVRIQTKYLQVYRDWEDNPLDEALIPTARLMLSTYATSLEGQEGDAEMEDRSDVLNVLGSLGDPVEENLAHHYGVRIFSPNFKPEWPANRVIDETAAAGIAEQIAPSANNPDPVPVTANPNTTTDKHSFHGNIKIPKLDLVPSDNYGPEDILRDVIKWGNYSLDRAREYRKKDFNFQAHQWVHTAETFVAGVNFGTNQTPLLTAQALILKAQVKSLHDDLHAAEGGALFSQQNNPGRVKLEAHIQWWWDDLTNVESIHQKNGPVSALIHLAKKAKETVNYIDYYLSHPTDSLVTAALAAEHGLQYIAEIKTRLKEAPNVTLEGLSELQESLTTKRDVMVKAKDDLHGLRTQVLDVVDWTQEVTAETLKDSADRLGIYAIDMFDAIKPLWDLSAKPAQEILKSALDLATTAFQVHRTLADMSPAISDEDTISVEDFIETLSSELTAQLDTEPAPIDSAITLSDAAIEAQYLSALPIPANAQVMIRF